MAFSLQEDLNVVKLYLKRGIRSSGVGLWLARCFRCGFSRIRSGYPSGSAGTDARSHPILKTENEVNIVEICR